MQVKLTSKHRLPYSEKSLLGWWEYYWYFGIFLPKAFHVSACYRWQSVASVLNPYVVISVRSSGFGIKSMGWWSVADVLSLERNVFSVWRFLVCQSQAFHCNVCIIESGSILCTSLSLLICFQLVSVHISCDFISEFENI